MTATRRYLRADIMRCLDEPDIVECQFTDCLGQKWSIHEKMPVVTADTIYPDDSFPQPAVIACEIISRGNDQAGNEIVTITTDRPWTIEATDGTSEFQVFAHQLVTVE